ncbi:MAG: RluA family pseudouridine synthase, partial [Lachnospiraceae bacterium]|nr:RluA family pseudouridine synthase [Lachnospiraceae bacterium]
MKDFFTVENQEGERVDKYLSEVLENRSRSYIQKLIKDQCVIVNQKPVKASYRLLVGDRVEITLPEIKELDLIPEDIPLDILYEDEDVLVINKPKQMVVHPAPGHLTGTLVNALMYHCSGLSGI